MPIFIFTKHTQIHPLAEHIKAFSITIYLILKINIDCALSGKFYNFLLWLRIYMTMYHTCAEERPNIVNIDHFFSAVFHQLSSKGFIFLVVRVSTSYCTWKSIFSLLCIAINKWFSVTTTSFYVIHQKRLDILFVLQYDIIYHEFIEAEKISFDGWEKQDRFNDHLKMIPGKNCFNTVYMK